MDDLANVCALCGLTIERQGLDPCHVQIDATDTRIEYLAHADCLRATLEPDLRQDVWRDYEV
jgi:hypothetical protein